MIKYTIQHTLGSGSFSALPIAIYEKESIQIFIGEYNVVLLLSQLQVFSHASDLLFCITSNNVDWVNGSPRAYLVEHCSVFIIIIIIIW